MKLESAINLYQNLKELFPTANPRGLETSTGWARNQPKMNLAGRILFSPIKPVEEMSAEERNQYFQGFLCIELNFTVSWGGATHSEQPITEPRVSVHILDRRARWDGPRKLLVSGQWDDSEMRDGIRFEMVDEVVAALKQLDPALA